MGAASLTEDQNKVGNSSFEQFWDWFLFVKINANYSNESNPLDLSRHVYIFYDIFLEFYKIGSNFRDSGTVPVKLPTCKNFVKSKTFEIGINWQNAIV